MSLRVVRSLAWACVPLTVLSLSLAVVFQYLRGQGRGIEILTELQGDIVYNLLLTVTLAAYPLVGALIVARHPRHAIGWLFCVGGLGYALSILGVGYGDYALHAHPGAPDGPLALWLAIWLFRVTFGLTGTFAPLLFPSGHLPSHRWRPVVWATGVGLALISVNAAFMPGPLQGPLRDNPDNPFGIAPAAGLLRWVGVVAAVVLVAAGALAVLSVLVRFRRARGVERAQLKWFALAAALLATWAALGLALDGLGIQVPRALVNYVFAVLIALPAVAVGIAILRYRLYDIDVLINRTLVYGTLTAALAGVYLGAVALFQGLFQGLLRGLTGQRSDLAVVAATLLVAVLFHPLRQRLQAGIDRRFYRRKYDAARTLAAFGAAARDEVDLDRLTADIVAVVEQTLHPAHVSLWLPPRAGDGPSPEVSPALEMAPDDPLLAQVRGAAGPVDLATVPRPSPARQALRAAGVTLLVPLVSQDKLLGLLRLGPRRGGQGYSADDRALLANLATQATPAVRVAQLVRQEQAELLARERVEQELRVARQIQHTLLPHALPTVPGWQVASHYQPAREVGGDFYDFLALPDGRLGLLIGDVSDKGVPAALVMATTRSILRGAAQQVLSPGQVLARANELLYLDTPPAMFVTCLYALLDPASGQLRYANAGHDLPYLRHAGGVCELHARGMPLGLLPGMCYEERTATIAPAELVLLYSDGLVEAHDAQREMFGFPRLQDLVAAHAAGDSTALIEALLADLRQFTGAAWEQEDDITLVTLQRCAAPASRSA